MKKILALVLTIAMLLATACTEVAEVEDEASPYANLPEMENLNARVSTSGWGNKFGDIKITLNWETDNKLEAADIKECYLEYSYDELDPYERVKPNTESVDIFGKTERLVPFTEMKLKADLDSYYDYCDVGYYRLAIVFDAMPNDKDSEERVAYVELGGNAPEE